MNSTTKKGALTQRKTQQAIALLALQRQALAQQQAPSWRPPDWDTLTPEQKLVWDGAVALYRARMGVAE